MQCIITLAFFPFVAVIVRANRNELKTSAVLDQCSTLSLCTDNLLSKLQLKGTSSPLIVDTLNGLCMIHNSVTANLQICSLSYDARKSGLSLFDCSSCVINTLEYSDTYIVVRLGH